MFPLTILTMHAVDDTTLGATAQSVAAPTLAELRALPASALLKGEAGMISHPVVEPYVMPRSPYEVFAAGEQNDAPILMAPTPTKGAR